MRLPFTLALFAFGSVSGVAATIVNGDFQTGDLTGWTIYTTSFGPGTGSTGRCAGAVACPAVTSFDTSGAGASDAVEFNVGLASGAYGTSDTEGGGIYQNIDLQAGLFTASVEFAIDNADPLQRGNADGGTLSILLDNAVVATFASGPTSAGVRRGELTGSVDVTTAGLHRFALQATRNYYAPALFQYFDNVETSGTSVTPEPAALSFAACGMLLIAGRLLLARLAK